MPCQPDNGTASPLTVRYLPMSRHQQGAVAEQHPAPDRPKK